MIDRDHEINSKAIAFGRFQYSSIASVLNYEDVIRVLLYEVSIREDAISILNRSRYDSQAISIDPVDEPVEVRKGVDAQVEVRGRYSSEKV